MKKVFLFTLLNLTLTYYINGQASSQGVEVARTSFQTKQIIPPSPDAAALGQYGNVPVSLFTGAPNISVPLSELKGNFLAIPFTMSYNFPGFKPEEIAPWTGLGWALNAGGVITRSVIGNPDVADNYFKSPSPLIVPSNQASFEMYLYLESIKNAEIDVQPDIYYYNFMGRSGKFYLTPGGSVFKKDNDMLQIIYTDGDFEITDEQGNKYIFSTKETTNTIPNDEAGSISYKWFTYTSSWYLTTVTSVNTMETLEFEYYAPTAKQSLYENAYRHMAAVYTYSNNGCAATSPTRTNEMSYSSPPTTQITRKFLKRVSLKNSGTVIKYADLGSVADQRQDLWLADFSGERRLDTVKFYTIVNGTTTLFAHYRLHYSYFAANGTGLGDLRLRLDSIKEMSLNVNTPDKPAYGFRYNTQSLPNRYVAGLDHWGYYNGSGQTTLIPTTVAYIDGTQKTYGMGADREPNFSASSRAAIKQIIYPTGGYTDFIFEGHDDVGGIRIKTITDYSFTNTPARIKNYTYSNVVKGRVPKYFTTSSYARITDGCMSGCNSSTSPTCFSSGTSILTIATNSVYGLGYVQGSAARYGNVTETIKDATGLTLGSTRTSFNTGFVQDYDESLGTGDMTGRYVYNSDGKLLESENYIYDYENVQDLYAAAITPESYQSNETIACEKNINGSLYVDFVRSSAGQGCLRSTYITTRYNHDDYTLKKQRRLLTQQITKKYDQISETYVTTTKTMTYGTNHNSPIKIVEETSNSSEVVITEIKYISDYSYIGTMNGDLPVAYKSMYSRNIKSMEVEKIQYRQNADGSNKRYLNGTINGYNSNGLPTQVFQLETATPLTTFVASTVSGGTFTYHSNYKVLGEFIYNSAEKLIQQRKSDDMPTAYVWDYNNNYPVASFTNALSSQVAACNFETGSTGGWTINTLSPNNSLAFAGNRSCNIVSTTQISKAISPATSSIFIVSYWSRGSALAVVANGSSVASSAQSAPRNGWYYYEHKLPIGTTSVNVSSANATIDDLRLFPHNSLVTTYAFEPEIGLSDQIGATNQLVSYEYDGLKRLVNVKDEQGQIIQNYKYNYGLGASIVAPQKLFYSVGMTQTFERSCPVGTHPTSHEYSVPRGKYVGLTQVEADQQATNELAVSGQALANEIGLCYFHNVLKTGIAFKLTCAPTEGVGLKYFYNVQPGRYKSTISQAYVDNQADADVADNTQAMANLHGSCSCDDVNQRYLNGVCEQGMRVNTGWSYAGTLGYKCYYYYLFSDGYETDIFYDYVSTAGACVSN